MANALAGAGADLELRGIRKEFPGFTAIEELDLKIPAGQFFALLGPSGCGKTTLLRIAAGIDKPDSGRLLFDGQEMAGPSRFVPPEKRNIGLMFQDYALFPHLTCRDNVAFGLKMRGVPKAERLKRAEAMLALVQMDKLAGRLPAQLSGGQQQRVAIARSLVNRPALVLADEPTSHVDGAVAAEALDLLEGACAEVGAALVVATHDPVAAARFPRVFDLIRPVAHVRRHPNLHPPPSGEVVPG